MTYNFDPDKWYETRRALLEKRLEAGDLDREAFEKAVEELQQRYAEMWKRLDGTFRIPE